MTRTIYKVVGDEPEGSVAGSTTPDSAPHPAEATVDAGKRGYGLVPVTGDPRRRGVIWVLAGIAILVIIMIVVIAVLEVAESPAVGTDTVPVAAWTAGAVADTLHSAGRPSGLLSFSAGVRLG